VNYTELKTQVEATVESSVPDALFATMVQQVERQVLLAVQLPAFRQNMNGILSGGNAYLSMPADFLYPYSLAVIEENGNFTYLLDKDVNYIRAVYPSPADTGVPRVYAIFDRDSFLLGPTPDTAYEVELHYGYAPESIVTAGTTWLGDNFDNVLLNGTLVEVHKYMKAEEDVMATAVRMYTDAMQLLKQLGDGKMRQDAHRIQQVRTPVK
jgi:hypothetical protein